MLQGQARGGVAGAGQVEPLNDRSGKADVAHWGRGTKGNIILGVDSPFFSAIVLFNNQPFPQGVWWLSRKKDPSKEWGSYP